MKTMKTTEKQFELFKSECKKWSKIFGLNGWRLDFFLESLANDSQAEVNRNYRSCVATVKLHTKLFKTDGYSWDDLIKFNAKHEMIHILLANLNTIANSRFISVDEIDKAEHELVRKLEKIIT